MRNRIVFVFKLMLKEAPNSSYLLPCSLATEQKPRTSQEAAPVTREPKEASSVSAFLSVEVEEEEEEEKEIEKWSLKWTYLGGGQRCWGWDSLPTVHFRPNVWSKAWAGQRFRWASFVAWVEVQARAGWFRQCCLNRARAGISGGRLDRIESPGGVDWARSGRRWAAWNATDALGHSRTWYLFGWLFWQKNK